MCANLSSGACLLSWAFLPMGGCASVLARGTPCFSGADLANLANEAAILATRRNATMITMQDFTLAVERIVAGLEKKNRILNDFERSVVAYHESGHVLVTMALPNS